MTNFFSLGDLGLATSTSALLADWLSQLQARYPGYNPSAANLEYIQALVFASWAADLAQQASAGSEELFRTYGTTLIGLPYQNGIAAEAIVSITAASQNSGIPITTTSAALSTSAAITSIPVNALAVAINPGSLTTSSGANTQTWTTTGAIIGATSIPVSSQTPNFNYPLGSNIFGTIEYTLSAGTQLTLDTLGFVTQNDLNLTAGSSGQVTVAAIQTGAAFNGAGSGGSVQLVAQTDWVTNTSLVTSASGGVDPEDDDHYLARLTATLQTMAQRPITASDYATLAVNFNPLQGTDQEEVGRSTAVDGYDPGAHSFTANTTSSSATLSNVSSFTGLTAGSVITGAGIPANTTVVSTNSGANTLVLLNAATASATGVSLTATGSYGNEREVTVCITDANGNALNTDTKTAVQALFQSLREVNFIINVIDPSYSAIYVTCSVHAQTGWDNTTVQSNAQNAIISFLSPVNWGLPANSSTGWQNYTIVYASKLTTAIQGAAGVDYIENVKFGLAATPTNAADLTLPGPIALPTSNTSTVPLSAITML